VVCHLHAEKRSIAYQVANCRGLVSSQHEDIADTLIARQFQLVDQKRSPCDIDECLREISQDPLKAGSLTACQDYGLHSGSFHKAWTAVLTACSEEQRGCQPRSCNFLRE